MSALIVLGYLAALLLALTLLLGCAFVVLTIWAIWGGVRETRDRGKGIRL